jgi:hypothetical protein
VTANDRETEARLLRQLREARGLSWADLVRGLRDTARQLAVTSLMHRLVASIQRTVARWESLTDRTSPGDRRTTRGSKPPGRGSAGERGPSRHHDCMAR